VDLNNREKSWNLLGIPALFLLVGFKETAYFISKITKIGIDNYTDNSYSEN